jgi:hypothetical protein
MSIVRISQACIVSGACPVFGTLNKAVLSISYAGITLRSLTRGRCEGRMALPNRSRFEKQLDSSTPVGVKLHIFGCTYQESTCLS